MGYHGYYTNHEHAAFMSELSDILRVEDINWHDPFYDDDSFQGPEGRSWI